MTPVVNGRPSGAYRRVGDSRHAPLPPRLCAALRAARLRRGWSCRTAAKHVGVSWSLVSRIETGRRTPSVETARRLIDVYRLDGDLAGQLMARAAHGVGRDRGSRP